MLQERYHTRGPASSVIIVIAPGMEHFIQIEPLLSRAVDQGVRIAAINYPGILRPLPLDRLAHATGGPHYTVMEQCYKSATSHISVYFKLANFMFSTATLFYQGSITGMPLQVRMCFIF
jgi:hypothetical protein